MTPRTRVTTLAAALSLFAWAGLPAEGQSRHTNAAANAYVSARDWNGLLQYASEWTRMEPNDPMGWYYLGNTYGRGLDRPEQARLAFERAVVLRATWREAWNALGFVHVALKHFDEAAKAFAHAVEQAPARANYWNSLAAAYSYANRLGLAVKTLEDEGRAIARTGTDADWFNLGNGFFTMQEPAQAAPAYRHALGKNPRYAAAWNNLGALEGSLGNTAGALSDYQRAAALGDATGAGNLAKLRRAIDAAREARSDDPMKAFWRGQAHEAEYRAQQAWQERLARAQG